MALLLTCGDGEERGEVYGCAADRQQASIVFEVAADMVRMCPALNKRVKILASQNLFFLFWEMCGGFSDVPKQREDGEGREKTAVGSVLFRINYIFTKV